MCESLPPSSPAVLHYNSLDMALLDLFRPRWKRTDPAVRLDAVARLTDRNILAAMASTDPDERVRAAAARILSDQARQAVLAGVAKTAGDADARRVAIEKLTDQAVLVDIARTEKDAFLRQTAVFGLTDKAALAAIVANDEDADVRKAAESRLAALNAKPAGAPKPKATPLQGLIIIFTRDFSEKDVFVNSILTKMRARGRPYAEWMTETTPVHILVNPRAQDPSTFAAMAMVQFRRLGINFNVAHLEHATFEGSHGIDGVVLSHWSR